MDNKPARKNEINITEAVTATLTLFEATLQFPKPVSGYLVNIWVDVLESQGCTADDVQWATTRAIRELRTFPAPAEFLPFAIEGRDRRKAWEDMNKPKAEALPEPMVTREQAEAIRARLDLVVTPKAERAKVEAEAAARRRAHTAAAEVQISAWNQQRSSGMTRDAFVVWFAANHPAESALLASPESGGQAKNPLGAAS